MGGWRVAGDPGLPTVEILVRDLFGALAEGLPLASAAAGISRALRCHVTGLHHEESSGYGRMELGGKLGVPEMVELADEYEKRWQGQNLWIERGAAMLRRQGFQASDRIVSDAELVASPYYQNILRRMDVRHAIGVSVLEGAERTLAVLSFNRACSRGPLSNQEVALVSQLRPHLVNAYAIYDRISHLRSSMATLRSNLDAVPLAVLAMDVEGRVLQRNASAEALLGDPASRLACAADGMLLLRRGESRAPLAAALRDFAIAGAAALPRTVVVSRVEEGAERNRVMHLCSVPAGAVFRRAQLVALVVDLDLGDEEVVCQGAVQAALGVTAREAAVVLALRQCGDVEGAAMQLGLRVSTVRSHLKNVYARLHVNRQTELVRLVDRVVRSVPVCGPRRAGA